MELYIKSGAKLEKMIPISGASGATSSMGAPISNISRPLPPASAAPPRIVMSVSDALKEEMDNPSTYLKKAEEHYNQSMKALGMLQKMCKGKNVDRESYGVVRDCYKLHNDLADRFIRILDQDVGDGADHLMAASQFANKAFDTMMKNLSEKDRVKKVSTKIEGDTKSRKMADAPLYITRNPLGEGENI